MRTFIIGSDKLNLFKRNTIYSFERALREAVDGDTLQFQEGYDQRVEEGASFILIEKNINIVGTTSIINGEVQISCRTKPIRISNGAKVSIENIHIINSLENTHNLLLNQKSEVRLNSVIVENIIEREQKHQLIRVIENSKIDIESSSLIGSATSTVNSLSVNNSELNISNSYVSTFIYTNESTTNIFNCNIIKNRNNTLNAKGSKLNIENTIFDSGDNEKEFPCVHITNCSGHFKNNVVKQVNYNCALRVIDSNLEITNGLIDSLLVSDSEINLNEVTINESISLDNSKLNGSILNIMGRKNGKINFHADKNSFVSLKEILIHAPSNPNVKVHRSVDLLDENLTIYVFNKNSNGFVKIDKLNDVEYFGEETSDKMLEKMIGISNVKDDVKEFIAIAQMNKMREQQGLKTSVFSLHSMFLGNPGTGKTTVARIIGKLLFEKNVISKDILVEVSRVDLVGEYIGSTAIKTREVLQSALGGVLFIDEAYTLSSGYEKDFGTEAINEILSFMENNRNDIVIIFAGYSDDMSKFLDSNDGLKSRIPNIFNFPDYTIDELVEIGLIDLKSQEYNINENLYKELIAENYKENNDFSNGRWARNLNEKLIRKLALRVMNDNKVSLMDITDEDIKNTMP